MKKSYKVEVDCANCAAKMENAIKKIDGIKDASINFMMLKLNIEFNDDTNIDKIMKKVIKECRKIEPDCEIYI